MAYCKNCGAYIPDGQSKCLACGYDDAQQDGQNTGQNGGYAYSAFDEERLRAEEERRRAEEEEQKRRAQEEARRKRQEEYRQNAEAEFRRRQEAQARQKRRTYDRAAGHPYSSSGRVDGYASTRRKSTAGNKFLAAASYFGILCALPYIFCPDDKFAMFHARQGVALLLFDIAASIIGSVVGIGGLLKIFTVICIVKGVAAAVNGRTEHLPLIGGLADKIR